MSGAGKPTARPASGPASGLASGPASGQPDAATARQHVAARPDASAWVAANAGSGKTKVLTDRVARLLLGGVAPERVLCLTYTKAAAAEMQNRLFKRLGEWAMLPDEKLRAELRALGAGAPGDAAGLAEARRLFARAIEAPGGLKIQTIHAFSAALLRRFPLEAGVSPDFAEIDERGARRAMEEVVEAMAGGPLAPRLEALAAHYTGEDFAALTAEIARHRERLGAGPGTPPAALFAESLARFGLPEGFSEARLLAEAFDGGEAKLFAALLPLLAASSANDAKAAAQLAPLNLAAPSLATLEALEGPFLYGARATKAGPFAAKLGDFPTKAFRQGPAAPLIPALEALMARVEAARPRRLSLLAARRDAALRGFAHPFLAGYAARKQAAGRLDFDDLILTARRLLSDRAVAQWVLYRLDGGIDHILVDEAQDTSPEQWDVIRLIAEEFSTGLSARSDRPRTLFVVGDVKQSIYSFQGADPANFGRMADHFAARLDRVETPLVRVELSHSFRSAPAILRVVDAAFARPEHHAGLGGAPTHHAYHGDRPGRVDLWPVVLPDESSGQAAGEADWTDPVDRIDPTHPDLALARMIAKRIAALCDGETGETLPVPGGRRPLVPGDFLILVQRRSALFAELIRACKTEGLPIAGADRLRLGAELAVKDIAALLSFLATPEDDLSLAAALRSPLFGWSEDRLYRLAAGRGARFLWEALREARPDDTLAMLDDLRGAADFLRPFELIERILIRHDGRRRLIARLGAEAEDGIDALVAQAMAYERSDVPSLTGFLGWMETDELEVKRQLDASGGVLRVMTVHGAKGLEAPVVILPDTRPPQGPDRGEILPGADGEPLWRMNAGEAPPAIARALEARKARDAEERMRLLYVAMTRAESWLIVAGAGDMGRGAGGWHGIVEEALRGAGAEALDTPAGPGLRHASGRPWNDGRHLAAAKPAAPPPLLPGWARSRLDAAPEAGAETLSPSDLGGAKALPGEAGAQDEAAALLRGRRLHLLFEHLPEARSAERAELARRLLAAGPDAAEPETADALAAEALRVLGDPSLAEIFAPGALAEVEISAEIPGLPRPILGAIDRLIVTPERIRIVDFKTNALVPARPEETPEGILRQMAAYAAAVSQLYPDRKVEAAILWTAAPALMELPPALLDAALGRAGPP